MSVAPPALARFCRLKQHPRKLALYNAEYKLKCRDHALEKLANYSINKARQLLLAAKGQKRAVDALTAQDEVGRKKGYVARNRAAADLELAALGSAVRKHINAKVKGKTIDRNRRRVPRATARRSAPPAASGQPLDAEELTRYREENARLKQENASLRNSVVDLRRDLFQAQRLEDPIQRFITDTLREAREFANNEQEWQQIKKRLALAFHPDKNVSKQTAHNTWVAMQNHPLYQSW